MTRVFAKDLTELLMKPFLGIWILLVPLCLIYVAGTATTHVNPLRVLVQETRGARPAATDVRRLVGEFSHVVVLPHPWSGSDVLSVMDQHQAELAVQWVPPRRSWEKGVWRLFVRHTSRSRHTDLVTRAHEIALSLALGKPWQVVVAERLALKQEPRFKKALKTEVLELGGPIAGQSGTLIAHVMAVTVVFLPFLLACSALAKEWEDGTLATLLVAPGISWWNVVSAKILVAMTATTICFLTMLIVAIAYFHIPPRFSLGPTLAIQLTAMATSTFLGVAAACLTRSLVQAYFCSALYIFCLIFLTGISFPISGAGMLVRIVAKAFPLTFSFPALHQWLVYGSSTWLYEQSLYWLIGQCGLGAALMLVCVSFARRQL